MTGIKVVDASALAAVLFAEPEGQAVAEQLEGARLVAPTLINFELANVCLVKIRRQPNQREILRAAFRLLRGLKLEIFAVEHDVVLDLAEATKLTAYDASYLWLARALSADLVTLDRKLATVAELQ